MTAAIGVMAKAPVAGEVKTRLCPPLTPQQAREAAVAMLADSAQTVAAVDAAAWCVHTGDPALLRAHLPAGTALLAQRGAGLAERLAAAQADLHARGHDRVLLIGGDCPTLDRDDLVAALAVLDDHDVVLAPAVDGGYTAVGTRRPCAALFAVEMSTDRVLDETVARARAAGLSVGVTAVRGDLDTAEDLVAALDAGWLRHAPRTAAWARRVRAGTSTAGR